MKDIWAQKVKPKDLVDDPVRKTLMRELKEEMPPIDEDDVVRITPITLKRNTRSSTCICNLKPLPMKGHSITIPQQKSTTVIASYIFMKIKEKKN